jgi:DNA-binding transcriptional MocR family regulator
VERAKAMTTIATSFPAQAAIVEFLKHGGFNYHLRRLRKAFESQQSRMLQAIARHFPAATRLSRPEGGYFLWVEMPERVNALEVHRLAAQQRITVAPGPIFSPQREFQNCLRLNYGMPWSPKVESAVATVGRIVGSLA